MEWFGLQVPHLSPSFTRHTLSTNLSFLFLYADRTLSGNLYMFDEIVIIDRWASHRHNPTTGQWNKMNADVFREVEAPKDWWAPVRESMMLSLGIENVVSCIRNT